LKGFHRRQSGHLRTNAPSDAMPSPHAIHTCECEREMERERERERERR